jgi:hypothetical protein
LAEFEDELRAKREAGVTIELLVSPAAEVPDPEKYDYTEVATTARSRRGVTTPVAAVGDGEFSLYATREAVSRGKERYGVVFNRSELGFLVSGFVSTVLWASGETLATTPDRSLPRRYASLRRCVEEVEALDGSLRATVEGRDVLSGEPRDVAGEVVDTTRNDEESIASLTLDTDDGAVRVAAGWRRWRTSRPTRSRSNAPEDRFFVDSRYGRTADRSLVPAVIAAASAPRTTASSPSDVSRSSGTFVITRSGSRSRTGSTTCSGLFRATAPPTYTTSGA